MLEFSTGDLARAPQSSGGSLGRLYSSREADADWICVLRPISSRYRPRPSRVRNAVNRLQSKAIFELSSSFASRLKVFSVPQKPQLQHLENKWVNPPPT